MNGQKIRNFSETPQLFFLITKNFHKCPNKSAKSEQYEVVKNYGIELIFYPSD